MKFKVENFLLVSDCIYIFGSRNTKRTTGTLVSSYFSIVNRLTLCKNLILELKINIIQDKLFTLDMYASKLCKYLSNYEFIKGRHIGNNRFKYKFRYLDTVHINYDVSRQVLRMSLTPNKKPIIIMWFWKSMLKNKKISDLFFPKTHFVFQVVYHQKI